MHQVKGIGSAFRPALRIHWFCGLLVVLHCYHRRDRQESPFCPLDRKTPNKFTEIQNSPLIFFRETALFQPFSYPKTSKRPLKQSKKRFAVCKQRRIFAGGTKQAKKWSE